MADKRDRILVLKEYLSSLGISVNIGKNKARGHKGIFMRRFNNYRIDISKELSEDKMLPVVLHEFGHYIHYTYDSSLKNLDFIFGEQSEELREELIKITVQEVPKDFASALYSKKKQLNTEIKALSDNLKQIVPDFKLSERNKSIEKNMSMPIKYLTKYDNVKFLNKVYSLSKLKELNLSDKENLYLIIKSKQRALNRINSKINRLNRYYNNPSELFARFLGS